MGKFIDLTGQQFGRLTVIKRAGTTKSKHTSWLCKCVCGKEVKVTIGSLQNGHTKSCGCLQKEIAIKNSYKNTFFYKNGITKKPNYKRLSSIYNNMKNRCYYIKSIQYKNYGGRGIKVCAEWLDKEKGFENFYNWAMQNGYREDLSIDRIDVNSNYEPNNCRWVTRIEQCNNKTTNHIIKYNGEYHTLSEWCKILNLNYKTVIQRINKSKWDIDKAFTYPVKRIKKVVQLDKDYNIIKIWDNILMIQREKGYIDSSIGACCNNQRKTAYGFIWKFYDDFFNKED